MTQRETVTVKGTVTHGHEYGVSLEQLRAKARIVSRLAAVVGPSLQVRFLHDGRAEVRTGAGKTMMLGSKTDEAVWAEQARALADDRKPKIVYVHRPTLEELWIEQKALEMDLRHEAARAQLAQKEAMRQNALARRRG